MSESKSKRNSFFFFSSSTKASGNKPELKTANVKHIGKYPLKLSSNKEPSEPALDWREHSGSGSRQSTPRAGSSDRNEASDLPVTNATNIKRTRPPPPQDFSLTFPDVEPKLVQTASSVVQPSLSLQNKGHERKKSEIDELMDHLDHYDQDNRQQFNDGTSSQRSSSSGDFRTPSLDLPDQTDRDTEINNPDIRSLNLSQSKLSLLSHKDQTGEAMISPPQQTGPFEKLADHDEDQFSYAQSQGDSIQDSRGFSRVANQVARRSSGFTNNAFDDQPYHAADDLFDMNAPEDVSLFDSQSLLDNPRQFRVVNEHRPHFILNDESSTTDTDSFLFPPRDAVVLSNQQNDLKLQTPVSTNFPVAPSPTVQELDYHQKDLASSSGSAANDTTSSKSGLASDYTLMHAYNDPQNVAAASAAPRGQGTDRSVRLVSSYVEELRLKYFPTSNSLQPPPDLPFALKTKNTLEQPQNIKVRIRTSSKQIGIKHGKAKQKLLSLETAKEENESVNSPTTTLGRGKSVSTQVDHTREFHDLLNKSPSGADLFGADNANSNKHIELDDEFVNEEDDGDLYLQHIPGDEAYDNDDVMAPLREVSDHDTTLRFADNPVGGLGVGTGEKGRLGRSDTVTSYYTRKNQNRARSGTLDVDYSYRTVGVSQNEDPSATTFSDDNSSVQTPNPLYYQSTFGGGLRVTNQDPASDS
ncbi:LADA_0D06348g1_1 [Lachancea dasiensis]|uniref:LADA_0D06348g1_1 n=1 Tax=Lachancea dasiensis TaxID=1072105 RepID=A0A1G4J649_9SACH|nr:LADA_0D06348g1_1 [Lachancea dasiensis]